MKKKSDWKKEAARDFLALGGWAFVILMVARSSLGLYLTFTYQMILSLIILVLLGLIIKNYQGHIARAIILSFFTILFYSDNPDSFRFTVFVILAFIIMIFSAFYLKKDKIDIIKGAVLGIISTVIGYYTTLPIINILKLPI